MVQLNFEAVGNPLPDISCQINTTSEEDYLIPLDVCYVPIVFLNNRDMWFQTEQNLRF